MTRPRRRTLLLAMVIAAGIAVSAATPGAWMRATDGAAVSGDEPHYLVTAISLAEDGDLDVSDEMDDGRYRPFHEPGLSSQAGTRRDGSAVVPHDPLLPAVLAPAWRIAGWRGAKLALALLGGVLAALLVWTAVRRLAVPVWPATGVVAVFSASVPLAPYATQIYPEVPAALAVTAAIAAIPSLPRPAAAVGVGLAVVALPWLAVKYVPAAAALAGVALWRLWRTGERARLGWLAAGLGGAAVAYVAAHLAWYGGVTVYAAGDFFQEHGGQLSAVGTRPDYAGRARRLIGLLIGRDFGLAAWQPAWLLMVPALACTVRRRPPQWATLVAPLAAGWLVATFVALTMQGWWVPGRQVVHVLPAAVLTIAWWAGRLRWRLVVAGVLGALGVWSYGWLLTAGLSGDLTWVVDLTTTTDPWYRLWRGALPSYLDVSAATWVLQGLWLAVLGAAAVRTWTSVPSPHRAPVS